MPTRIYRTRIYLRMTHLFKHIWKSNQLMSQLRRRRPLPRRARGGGAVRSLAAHGEEAVRGSVLLALAAAHGEGLPSAPSPRTERGCRPLPRSARGGGAVPSLAAQCGAHGEGRGGRYRRCAVPLFLAAHGEGLPSAPCRARGGSVPRLPCRQRGPRVWVGCAPQPPAAAFLAAHGEGLPSAPCRARGEISSKLELIRQKLVQN